jgi:hypothetical protein
MSCEQSPDEQIAPKTVYREWEPEATALRLLSSFELNADGLCYDTDAVNAGEVAGTFYIPETVAEDEGEAPQITYLLVGGQGSEDNGRFEIDGADLKIADDPLAVGEYAVRVRADDADNNNGVEKKFTFRVTLEPPAMKKKPVLYPNFIGDTPANQNKLTVEWNEQRGATGYTVYISNTDDNPNAGTTKTVQTTYTTTSAVIDTFPDEDGKLPDSTRYWVWVKWTNSKGTSDFSPVATVKTFDPIDPWWYEDVRVFAFDIQEADWYHITDSTVEYGFGTQGGWNFVGDIIHHEVFDPEVVEEFFPQRGKHSEDMVGFPAGIFIIKYRPDRQPTWTHPAGNNYMGVYYWGKGVIGDARFGMSSGPLAYIINSYAGPAEQKTFVDALEAFTGPAIRKWNAGVAEPYYRVMSE